MSERRGDVGGKWQGGGLGALQRGPGAGREGLGGNHGQGGATGTMWLWGCVQTVSAAWPTVGILRAGRLPWAKRGLCSQGWLGAGVKGSREVWKPPPRPAGTSGAREAAGQRETSWAAPVTPWKSPRRPSPQWAQGRGPRFLHSASMIVVIY